MGQDQSDKGKENGGLLMECCRNSWSTKGDHGRTGMIISNLSR